MLFLPTSKKVIFTKILFVSIVALLLLHPSLLYAQTNSSELITKWILQIPDGGRDAFSETSYGLDQRGKSILLSKGKYTDHDLNVKWVIKEKQTNKLQIRAITDGSFETVTFWLINGKDASDTNTKFLIGQTENGQNIAIKTWGMKNDKIQEVTLFKTPTANNFLEKSVPGGDNQGGIVCSIESNGYKISCEPHTLMESFWTKHKVAYDITFEWNSKSFVLHRKCKNSKQ